MHWLNDGMVTIHPTDRAGLYAEYKRLSLSKKLAVGDKKKWKRNQCQGDQCMRLLGPGGWKTCRAWPPPCSSPAPGATPPPCSSWHFHHQIFTSKFCCHTFETLRPQYLVTKSVPEVQALKKEIPVLRHLDGSFYLRCHISLFKLIDMCGQN